MKLNEYNDLQSGHYDGFTPSMLKNKEPRTLLYWYTVGRDDFHCYLDERGFVNVIIYDYDFDVKDARFFWPEDKINFHACTANKRAYPECCDKEFITEMLKAWVDPNFTTFNEKREERQFYWLTN